MPAGLYDMVCEQGATFSRTITWKDAAGDPVNLTGYSARMQVRPSLTSDEITLELTSTNGEITFPSPLSSGKILITVAATDTADLAASKGVYDLELESSGGVVTRLLQGSFTIVAEVTR